MPLRVIHQSGKWSCTVSQLTDALDWFVGEHRADVITLTEVSPEKFRQGLVLWAAKHSWHVHHPGADGANECAVLSRFPITHRRSRRLTKLKLKVGRTAPTFLVSAHVKGWGWFSVLHTPAHTGGLKTYGKYSWPTRVYRSVLDGLHVARLRTRRFWTLLADWNLDLRLDRNRELLERRFPRMTLLAQKNQKATEGGRVIDGGLTTLDVREEARTLSARPGLDHNAVLVVLQTPS